MKVIFLDIDGVLIRLGDGMRKYRGVKRTGGVIFDFDPELVINLVKILRVTGAKIVISSSWRHNMERVYESMKDAGINPDYIIGRTPCGLGYGRGNEILSWIYKYNRNTIGNEKISEWVAIDDDSADMKCINRLGLFVHTKPHEGLTQEKVKECIRLLVSNINIDYDKEFGKPIKEDIGKYNALKGVWDDGAEYYAKEAGKKIDKLSDDFIKNNHKMQEHKDLFKICKEIGYTSKKYKFDSENNCFVAVKKLGINIKGLGPVMVDIREIIFTQKFMDLLNSNMIKIGYENTEWYRKLLINLDNPVGYILSLIFPEDE